MKHFRSIIGLTFISTFLLSGVLLLVLGYLWFQAEKQSMVKGYQTFQKEYTASQKALIRNEVQNAIDFITYSKSLTEKRVREEIRSRVYEAHAVASHIYDQRKESLPKSEIIDLVRESLRPIRFNDGRGYYFMTRLDGGEILFTDRPELEGINILSMQDTKEKWVIKDMIAIVRNKGEGFYSYTWTKPRHKGRDFRKIAFVKYFEPFDCFIGTGEYIDDTEATIRQEVVDRIQAIRFGEDGYVFILKSDGTMVSHINPSLIGENLMEFKDPEGFKVVEGIIREAQNPGGGYIRYLWNKPSLDREVAKISYARRFPEWNWIIGAGIYLDDLESALTAAKIRLDERATSEFKLMGMLFFVLLLVLLSLALYLSRRMAKGLNSFDAFFDRAVTHHEKIDESKLPFEEFKVLANRANVMVDDMADARRELAELNQNLEQQVLERTAELERANRELIKLDEMKSTFISTVSHELRTPLTSILGFTKLIGRDVKRHYMPCAEADATLKRKTERMLDNLAIMEDEGDRLTRLICDILDLSKIDSGKMEWRHEPVHLKACIGMAVNSLSGQLDSKPNITLEQSIAPDLPAVMADNDKITQVIINLAGNALKFMDTGTISIEANSVPGGVQVLVRDEGPGISPEDQEVIFNSFSQGENGTMGHKPSGTGLGLTISRQIIQHFKGRIWVESDLGKGSCFGFFLPENG